MSPIDWAIIVVYFIGIAAIVWWSSRHQDTSEDYFLAGRDVAWFAVGASVFASNIGSEHIVGLAGSGAINGMAQAHWELQAWILLLLAWFFVPFYFRSGVFTMPEFLEKRFDARSRWVLSVVSLVAYVFTKVSVTVYAGALVFRTLLPDTFGTPDNAFWVGAFTTVILTGIYTVLGGLRAVVYTEVLQTGLLIMGSAFITFFGLSQLGGWGELQSVLSERADQFALWRPNSDNAFPWLGVLIASPIIGVWYWCTDQYIIQRTLSARSLADARRGAIWAGFLKVWPVFIFMVPGMIGYALHQKGLMTIPGTGDQIMGDMVFPTMVASLLPLGLRGLVVGSLLSALMSSLASLFNSSATLFTKDIYEKLRPGRSERELVRVGRIATGGVVVFGLLWIPIMKVVSENASGLYDYLQNVQGFLAPPITAVFLLGLFHKRTNGQGAFWALVIGFILGMAKLTLQTLVQSGLMQPTGVLGSIGAFNGYYFTGVLFAISILVVLGLSYLTPAQPDEQVVGLTYQSVTAEQAVENRASVGLPDFIATGVVLALVLGAYVYFSFWLS
ncbi:MAG: sodium:solute symporter [Gemmatimonadetes bacterium]|nr:sodium:solute symporter [Gemmatimonadota bacterium]